jgi:DNA polymerase-4
VISYTAADHVLLQAATELFAKLYDRRLLVRLLGVRFSHLVPGNYQIHLWDDTEEMIHLYQAIDSIKNRFGEGVLLRGGGMQAADAERQTGLKQKMPVGRMRKWVYR